MAVDLLSGLKWNAPKMREETSVRLEFQELFALLAMNQDFGHELLPREVWLSIQTKIGTALNTDFDPNPNA